jgi:hypothetical protein
VQRSVVEWRDANLDWLRTAWNQATGSTAAALVAALQAASNAGVAERVVTGTAGVDAQYAGVEQVAVLTFCTAAGTTVRLVYPAPKSATVLASGEIDATNATIAALITAALAVLVDSSGQPVIAYAGGVLTHRRRDQP